MTTELTVPKTLRDAIVYYADQKVCHDLMVAIRFPSGLCCVHCGDMTNVKFMESVQRFKCYGCRKQFSIKAGTVLEDSPISLTKWLPAFWLLTSAKNGISSCELGRSLGVTQKTAWFMLHRIRHILATGTFEKMNGTVEADETYIGGLERNKHSDKKLKAGRGTVGKSIVIAVLERSADEGKPSKVRTKVAKDTSAKTLTGLVANNVAEGSAVYTDAHKSYRGLSEQFVHQFIDHAVEYASGAVHTNGLENYFSLLKRTLKGTYVAVEPFHLTKYIDEQAFRFNSRKLTDAERFIAALRMASGQRLTYDDLTSAFYAYYNEVLPK
jgi:transposase-like protein